MKLPISQISFLAIILLFSKLLYAQPETSRPGEYLEAWFAQEQNLSGTLVILDLDETVLTTPVGQWLGHSAMFYHLLEELMQQDSKLTRNEAAATVDVLLGAVYPRVPLALTDTRIPPVVDKLQQRGAKVIGMTSRGVGIKDVTLGQLREAQVVFSDTGETRWIALDSERRARLENGVVFVSHGNRKGETLNVLLEEQTSTFKGISRIVMIDDKQKHLDDVISSLKKLDSSIRPDIHTIFCTFPRVHGDYRAQEARRQLMHFLSRWRADVVISRLIATDEYTRNLMLSHQPEKGRQCPCLPPG